MEIDGGDHRFFEGHPVFRTFFFALLLQRTAQNLTFDASAHRRACLRHFHFFGSGLAS